MTENNTIPFRKKPSIETSTETKDLMNRYMQLAQIIHTESWRSLLKEKKDSLLIASEELAEITWQIINRLLSWEETMNHSKVQTRQMYDTLQNNALIMEKLHAINMGLGSGEIDTIIDALLYLEKANREQFSWISTHIILTPNESVSESSLENPVAQMLADTIEMFNTRFSDKDFIETREEKKYKDRIYHLASLLPFADGVLKREGLPNEIHILWKKNVFTWQDDEKSHYFTREEIAELDPKIFGFPGSALALKISWVGTIIFSSQNKHHYTPEKNTSLLQEAVETQWMLLKLIGKNENNKKDLLTWLPLRRSFEEKAFKLFEASKESGSDISFVLIDTSFAIIDADHFKKVNDQYGHAAGDLVLKTLARTLMQKLKTEDIKVRWGGEEFWVFMQANSEDAGRAIQRAFDVIKGIVFQIDENGMPSISRGIIKPGYRIFSVTLSAGIAGNRDIISKLTKEQNISPEILIKQLTLDDLIREADKRLYRAKESWRDRIVWEDAPLK